MSWSAQENTFFWNKVAEADGYAAQIVDRGSATSARDIPPAPALAPGEDRIICPPNKNHCYIRWPQVAEGAVLHVQACATLAQDQNDDAICRIADDNRSSPVAILRVLEGSTIEVSFGEECPPSRYPGIIVVPDEYRATASTNELMCTRWIQHICSNRVLEVPGKIAEFGVTAIQPAFGAATFLLDVFADVKDIGLKPDEVKKYITKFVGAAIGVDPDIPRENATLIREVPVSCIYPISEEKTQLPAPTFVYPLHSPGITSEAKYDFDGTDITIAWLTSGNYQPKWYEIEINGTPQPGAATSGSYRSYSFPGILFESYEIRVQANEATDEGRRRLRGGIDGIKRGQKVRHPSAWVTLPITVNELLGALLTPTPANTPAPTLSPRLDTPSALRLTGSTL